MTSGRMAARRRAARSLPTTSNLVGKDASVFQKTEDRLPVIAEDGHAGAELIVVDDEGDKGLLLVGEVVVKRPGDAATGDVLAGDDLVGIGGDAGLRVGERGDEAEERYQRMTEE